MALCRHCGGRHLHKDCPRAPPPGLAGGRPAAKAAPAPRPGKGKGKGKGKSKSGTEKFDGLCNKCGRHGHRARDCRSVMALEDSQRPEIVNCMAEVIMSNALTPDNGMLLLVDSGACISTCPKTWCDWAPL
eukprot:10520775-Heterocapsa_arctica.AAC.1